MRALAFLHLNYSKEWGVLVTLKISSFQYQKIICSVAWPKRIGHGARSQVSLTQINY